MQSISECILRVLPNYRVMFLTFKKSIIIQQLWVLSDSKKYRRQSGMFLMQIKKSKITYAQKEESHSDNFKQIVYFQ